MNEFLLVVLKASKKNNNNKNRKGTDTDRRVEKEREGERERENESKSWTPIHYERRRVSVKWPFNGFYGFYWRAENIAIAHLSSMDSLLTLSFCCRRHPKV